MEKRVTSVSEFLTLLTKNRKVTVTGNGIEVTAEIVNGKPGTSEADISLKYRQLDSRTEGATILAFGVIKWALTSRREDAKSFRGSDPKLIHKLVNIVRNVDRNKVRWQKQRQQQPQKKSAS